MLQEKGAYRSCLKRLCAQCRQPTVDLVGADYWFALHCPVLHKTSSNVARQRCHLKTHICIQLALLGEIFMAVTLVLLDFTSSSDASCVVLGHRACGVRFPQQPRIKIAPRVARAFSQRSIKHALFQPLNVAITFGALYSTIVVSLQTCDGAIKVRAFLPHRA